MFQIRPYHTSSSYPTLASDWEKKRDLFNFVSLCFKFVNGFGPLSIFLIFFHSTHLPDSLVLLLTHVIFRISFFRSKFYRQRSFSCQGTPGTQGTWIQLPRPRSKPVCFDNFGSSVHKLSTTFLSVLSLAPSCVCAFAGVVVLFYCCCCVCARASARMHILSEYWVSESSCCNFFFVVRALA